MFTRDARHVTARWLGATLGRAPRTYEIFGKRGILAINSRSHPDAAERHPSLSYVSKQLAITGTEGSPLRGRQAKRGGNATPKIR